MENLGKQSIFDLKQVKNTDELRPCKTHTELYELIVSNFEADKLLLWQWCILRISEADFDRAVELGLLKQMKTCGQTYYYYDRVEWLPGEYSLELQNGHSVEYNLNEAQYPTSWNESLAIVDIPKFSYFIKPVKNTRPYKEVTIQQLYQVIIGKRFVAQTAQIQTLSSPAEKRKYKAASFDYFTVAGTFTQRADEHIKQRSGFIVLDFDHVQDPYTLRKTLIEDVNLVTILAFVSPSGSGLKWIVQLDLSHTHLKNFIGIANYIQHTYGLIVDPSGKDLSRACFVSHDPTCYINPDFAI